MDQALVQPVIEAFLAELGQRLDQAASVAKAAQACCTSGNMTKAVEIALDVEQLTYEANALLNSASFVLRLTQK